MPASSSANYAYVTLATNDENAKGAIVLAKSLRNHQLSSDVDIVAITTPQVSFNVSQSMRHVFDHVMEVDVYNCDNYAHSTMTKRPELGKTLTKIHCWTLKNYQKCVFMDPSTMVLQNIDDLFNREEFSAVADAGWPDIFNTGVFVFKPSNETFENLVKLANEEGSYDGTDQGLLNSYFSNWSKEDIIKHLSFLYNLQATSTYTYSPAFARFGKDTKVIHFVGENKPWSTYSSGGSYSDFMSMWKGLYEKKSVEGKSAWTVDQMTMSGQHTAEDYQNNCKSYSEIQNKIAAKLKGPYY